MPKPVGRTCQSDRYVWRVENAVTLFRYVNIWFSGTSIHCRRGFLAVSLVPSVKRCQSQDYPAFDGTRRRSRVAPRTPRHVKFSIQFDAFTCVMKAQRRSKIATAIFVQFNDENEEKYLAATEFEGSSKRWQHRRADSQFDKARILNLPLCRILHIHKQPLHSLLINQRFCSAHQGS